MTKFVSISLTWVGQTSFISEILTEFGLCYSFNLAISDNVVDKNLTSPNFHYSHFTIHNYPLGRTEKIPRKINTCDKGYSIAAWSSEEYYKFVHNLHQDDHLIFIHDPYEYPTRSSVSMSLNRNSIINVLLNPIFYGIDESLKNFNIQE